jgi:polysaccharide export outer membrane protein
MLSSLRFTAAFLLFASAAACKTTGDAIPVESLAPATTGANPEYILQAGDVIAVRVWTQDSITTRARIRPDGRISMPFLDDVEAAGSTPNALAKRIQAKLKDFIVNPVVTVSLEEPRPLLVAVLGEVVKPGNYPLEASAGVLQALANAGGMTPFASKNSIVVVRRKPDGSGVQRIVFTYSGLTQVQGRAANFRLQPGDVVVVE